METAIISIITVALIVVGGMTMSQGFLNSVDTTTSGLNQVALRDHEALRTNISIIGTSLPAADTVKVIVSNAGQTKLTGFDKWDLIVQYYDSQGDSYSKWLPYTSGAPGANQWTVTGIYIDAASAEEEVFEPGLFNPSEQIIIEAKLSPSFGSGTANQVLISTPNGVRASAIFITD